MKASACGPRGRAVILGDQAVGRDGGDDEAVGPDGGDVGGNNEYENYDEPGWGITEEYVLMIIVILIPMLKTFDISMKDQR